MSKIVDVDWGKFGEALFNVIALGILVVESVDHFHQIIVILLGWIGIQLVGIKVHLRRLNP